MTRLHTPNIAVLALVLAVLTLATTPVAVAASPGDTTTGTTIGDQLDGEGDTSDDSSGNSSTDDSTTSDDSSTDDSTTSDDSSTDDSTSESTSDDSTNDSSGETDGSTEDSTTSDDSTDDSTSDTSTDDSTVELSVTDTTVTATTDAVLPDSVTAELSEPDATGSLTDSPGDDTNTVGSSDELTVPTLNAAAFGTTTDSGSTDLTGTVDGTTVWLVGETGGVFDAISAPGTETTPFEPTRLQDVPEATQTFDEQRATRLTFGGASTPGSTPLPPAPTAGLALGVGALAAAGVTRTGAVTPSTLATLGSNLGTTVVAGVAPLAGRTGVFDRLLRMLAPFRYSRYDDSDPLEHDARADVYEVVTDAPGAYLSEVAEEADLPLSTARHHIRVLEREDLVSGAKVRGKRRFYPAYTQGIELAAALNDEATAAVIDAVSRLGAASVSDLANELERDPSTVSHHLKRLAEDDIIVRERDGRAVMNKLSSEARTALDPEQSSPAVEAGEAMASD